jgi:sarcosine oxidase
MIDRRMILTGATGAALAAGAASQAQAAPGRGGSPDVVVVGAGAFGGWAALSLRERGLKVVSVDQYGPSSPRSSSAGETRSIRSGYGSDAFYAEWAAKALVLWKMRQAEFGRTLLYQNDRLELANSWLPNMLAQRQIFDKLKIPYEVLERAELRRTYPQMNFDDVEFAFIEKTSAALIKARESMITVSEVFQKKGGEFRIARAMPGPSTGSRMTALALDGGETLSAAQFVFALGPWSPKILPDVMGPKISVNRSEYHYWGVPAGDDRFSWPKQPAWHDYIRGGYGFGSLERGLKYSPSGGGGPTGQVDPDTLERVAAPERLTRGRDYIAHRFPAMAGAPLLETRVCQMESPSNNHFIIDRHPAFENVWIASGGGGHGFKHGPMVGEYVADRITGRPTDPAVDKFFQLATHADRVRRG